MKIPDKLKIGGHVFDVEFEPELTNDDAEDLWGICEFKSLKIKINSDLP